MKTKATTTKAPPKVPTRIERVGKMYHVYVEGRYYGETPDRRTAERMMKGRRPNYRAFNAGNPKALWLAWNEAVATGATVLFEPEADHGNEHWQFIHFSGFFLGARPHGPGWEVRAWPEDGFHFWQADHQDGTYRLDFVTKPYHLEER